MCTVAEIGSAYRRRLAGTGTGAETAFLVIAFLYLVSMLEGSLILALAFLPTLNAIALTLHTQVLTD